MCVCVCVCVCVQVTGASYLEVLRGLEHVASAYKLEDGAEAKLCHDLAALFSNQKEVVDDVFGRAGELGTKLWVLPPERGVEERQYLYFCTSKTSKLSNRHEARGPAAPQVSAFVLLY